MTSPLAARLTAAGARHPGSCRGPPRRYAVRR